MVDGKSISKMIRERKKNSLRPDMDDAGQEAIDPNAAWDMKQDSEVNAALNEPDHDPASPAAMGEDESSQSKRSLAKTMSRINRYLDSMKID